jgi:orotate phosphoribosyltransferase-like protein
LTASGLTATKKGADDDLDAHTKAGLAKVAANDVEIDAGLDEIGNSLDRLAAISGAMNEEVRSQNQKLDSLTGNMERAADKQAMVNARLKRQLK